MGRKPQGGLLDEAERLLHVVENEQGTARSVAGEIRHAVIVLVEAPTRQSQRTRRGRRCQDSRQHLVRFERHGHRCGPSALPELDAFVQAEVRSEIPGRFEVIELERRLGSS
jgi:hypothetical protein